jgi:hypothetical protein
LHEHDVFSAPGANPQGIALVFGGGLIERRIQKTAGVVPPVHDLAGHGTAVGMHVEHVHENTDALCPALDIRIVGFVDDDHLAVGGRKHRVRIRLNRPVRVTEKLDHEYQNDPEWRRPYGTGEEVHRHRRNGDNSRVHPPLAREKRMISVGHDVLFPRTRCG